MPSASDGYGLDGASGPAPHPYTKDRPLLLPSGRKLRHLSSIALRNLGAAPALKEPPKSEEAVGSPRDEAEARLEDGNDGNDMAVARRRRRRSTMNFAPGEAKRWEGVVSRRGDVFFSLHVAGLSDPVYISEVVPKAMNPDFQGFNLSSWGPAVKWRDRVIIKVWNDIGSPGKFRLLLEADIHLGGLQYIGKTLEGFRHPLPQNCVVLFLTDGCYTDFADRAIMRAPSQASRTVSPTRSLNLRDHNMIQPTSSFDGLMRLITLEDCIYDATRTTSDITSQLDSILERKADYVQAPGKVSQKQESVKAIDHALTIARRRLEATRKKAEDQRRSLACRRSAIAAGRETQVTGENYVQDAQELLPRCRTDLISTREALEAQRKRIVSDLAEIYSIEPAPAKGPLAFALRGLYLPSSGHEDEDEMTTAAALGYVVHAIYLLSFYLSVPLRYPVQFQGSTSFVKDPISIIQGARTFPLWSKGTVLYRFEYGIFLVNKNIEQLMAAREMHCLDIRHTLPNLKSLLLFISAGGSALTHSIPPAIRRSIEFKPPSRPPSRILSRSPFNTHSYASSSMLTRKTLDEDDGRSVTFESRASTPLRLSPPPVSRFLAKQAVPALTYAPPTPESTPSPPTNNRRVGTVGNGS